MSQHDDRYGQAGTGGDDYGFVLVVDDDDDGKPDPAVREDALGPDFVSYFVDVLRGSEDDADGQIEILSALAAPSMVHQAMRAGVAEVAIRIISSRSPAVDAASAVSAAAAVLDEDKLLLLLSRSVAVLEAVAGRCKPEIPRETHRDVIGCLLRHVLMKAFPSSAGLQVSAISTLLMTACGCGCLEETICRANQEQILAEGGIGMVVEAMMAHRTAPLLLCLATKVLLQFTNSEAGIRGLKEVGAVRAVAQAIRSNIRESQVCAMALNFFVQYIIKMQESTYESAGESEIRECGAEIVEFGIVPILYVALRYDGFADDKMEVVQELGLLLLQEIFLVPGGPETILLPKSVGRQDGGDNRIRNPMVVDVVIAAMRNHPDSPIIQARSLSIVSALLEHLPEAAVSSLLSGAEVIPLICVATANYVELEMLGMHVLSLVSKCQDDSVKRIFVESMAPYLVISIEKEHLRDHADNPTTKSVTESACTIISNMGLDPDPQCTGERGIPFEIGCPPFDVGSIVDVDLLSSPPGWYKAFPFYAELHEKKGEEDTGEEVVGQEVVLRVMLPFGGRGCLYGSVVAIETFPADSDGVGTEIDATKATVHATVSLENSPEEGGSFAHPGSGGQSEAAAEAYKPLPTFFRGEKARYDAELRFNLASSLWEVIKITENAATASA